jgi:uncharacterized protein
VEYNDDAQLDTSEVSDARGVGGGGFQSAGGLGLIGLVLPFLFRGRSGRFSGLIVVVVGGLLAVLLTRGGSGGGQGVLGQLGQSGGPATANNTDLAKECRTGADANDKLECAVVADINSVQDYWGAAYPALATHYRGAQGDYREADTVFFTGQVSTACGSATSDAGPFYCPGDKLVYIDLSFYNQLKSQFGAEGGPLVNAYVLAHEYGHHVQDLLGTESKVKTREGAASDSVRLELQADCYAGVWMNHASQPQGGRPALIKGITQADLDSAVDTAQRIGDDYIQKNLGGGRVDPDSFTHGTSAQRKKWLTTGYRSGAALQCDTFSATSLG